MTLPNDAGTFSVNGLLYGVFDQKTGEILVIVEARDLSQAKQRADWVAPFFGWRHFDESQLRQIEECTDRTPTFFEDYFAVLDRGDASLH